METAGFYVSAFQMTGIVSTFLVPMPAGLKKDQRSVTFGVISFFLSGIVPDGFDNKSDLTAHQRIPGRNRLQRRIFLVYGIH